MEYFLSLVDNGLKRGIILIFSFVCCSYTEKTVCISEHFSAASYIQRQEQSSPCLLKLRRDTFSTHLLFATHFIEDQLDNKTCCELRTASLEHHLVIKYNNGGNIVGIWGQNVPVLHLSEQSLSAKPPVFNDELIHFWPLRGFERR